MKRTITLILAALLLLSFAACAGGDKPAPTAAPTAEEAALVTQEPALTAEPEAAPSAADIQYVGDLSYDPETDHDPRFGSFMTILIDAGDYFYWHEDDCYIRYCDKEGSDWGVLCGKPECVHDNGNGHWHNTECNGYMAEIGAMVWKYDDKIYYVNDWEGRRGESLGALYRMNLDGSGHEKLGMFPEVCGSFDEAMWPQCFYCHRGLLYTRTMFNDVVNGEPIKRTGYYAMNVDGSDQKIIYESSESGYGFMTFMGEYCYVLDFYPRKLGEDKYEYITKMMRWSPNSGKTELLYEGSEIQWPNEGELFMRDGDVYCPSPFVMHEGKRAVMRFHEGKWEELINFDDPEKRWTVFCVSDGIAIARNFLETDPESEGYDRSARDSADIDIWIKDFEGNTLYKGKLPVGWTKLPETPKPMRLWNFIAFGDSSTFYVLFEVNSLDNEDMQETDLFIRYDIKENGLEQTVIGVVTGAPIKD